MHFRGTMTDEKKKAMTERVLQGNHSERAGGVEAAYGEIAERPFPSRARREFLGSVTV